MRWLTRPAPGVILRWRTVAFFGLVGVIDIALACGQTDERDTAQNLISLRPDLIFAGTSLLAQNDQVEEEALPPSEFNPDPGAVQRIEPQVPPELFPPVLPQLPEYGEEPLPRSLELPRKGVHEVVPRRKKLGYETYPLSEQGEGLLPGSRPEPNRWFIGFGRWKRYADPSTETPYQSELQLWHPYLQSRFKGDAPIYGQDIFLNITVKDFFQIEPRNLPTPSGVNAEHPNSSEFFERGEQLFYSNDFSIGLDLFKGETAFKPVDWALHILGVYNHNYIEVEESNVVNPNPQQGTTREQDFFALQEAFGEIHLRDLSDNYDFISLRAGIQPFVSDFRGFIFNDANLGVRIFGNYDNNRWQYNIAAFDMLEKDPDSDLNEFSRREQQIYVANVFRQDLIWKGYTGELSFLANFDHDVQAYYLGWTGDGHIGWLNIDHAFYQVFGEDGLNGIAGKRVEISAQMAALELSVDKDWLRHKLSVFYGSGDHNPTNSHATGFDTVFDRPFFIGGPFSFFSHQAFNLGGTAALNFKQRNSLVVDFRMSKSGAQSNFVNPGVFIVGYGLDADITPKLKGFMNVNYVRTVDTATTELVLLTNHASNDFALDCSAGFQWRPLLTENIIVSAGAGFLIPRWGYKDIYQANTKPVFGFPRPPPGHVDDFLYSAIATVTLTY